MNEQGFNELSAVVQDMGCEIVPAVTGDVDVPAFDVVSETGALSPASITNAFRNAVAERRLTSVQPNLVAAQKFVVSFEDLSFKS